MIFADYRKIKLPEGQVKKITRTSDGLVLWEAQYTNQVPVSIDSDGSIYNGCGYIDGYRLSSSGTLKAQDNTVTSGFIPCTSTDIVRMAGTQWLSSVSGGYAYICYYDDAFNKLGTINKYEERTTNNNVSYVSGICSSNSEIIIDSSGITTFNTVFTDSPAIAYIRISAVGAGADMIVTINEAIS